MLKQRWTNFISTPMFAGWLFGNVPGKHSQWGAIQVKLHLKIYFHCTSSNETSKITHIRHSTKTPLDSCLSVLVKLYNICGYKILTGFCFKVVNKLKQLVKKRRRRRVQDSIRRLGWIIFANIKTAWNAPCQMFERILNTTLIICTEVYLQESCRCKSKDKVYCNTRVSTQVNTNQHESDTNQHESTRVRNKSTRVQHESKISLDHIK